MRKISADGLFCCDKFEETPKQKVIDLSKLKEIYFTIFLKCTALETDIYHRLRNARYTSLRLDRIKHSKIIFS